MNLKRSALSLGLAVLNISVLGFAIAACEQGGEEQNDPQPTPSPSPYVPYSPIGTNTGGTTTPAVVATADEPLAPDTTNSVCAIQYVTAPSCSQMKISPNASAGNANMCVKHADPVSVDKANLTQSFAKVTAAGQTGWVLRSELACQRPQ